MVDYTAASAEGRPAAAARSRKTARDGGAFFANAFPEPDIAPYPGYAKAAILATGVLSSWSVLGLLGWAVAVTCARA